jgi:hypothetical protein
VLPRLLLLLLRLLSRLLLGVLLFVSHLFIPPQDFLSVLRISCKSVRTGSM